MIHSPSIESIGLSADPPGWCGYCGTVFTVNYCEFGGEPILELIENAARFQLDRTFYRIFIKSGGYLRT
ncbi:hypothetical protein K4039_24420 [Lyngbya sp. CCAP 1446/10]|uniref:hypothetical protein n=1 Tax=Microcoleaceae TaxID=1892252 RepID=UPI0022375D64|nr:hypothetical protein [Lyngbya sp. CCAP 1446/10]MCW6053129.1 hypothetical protein [Lyngbya sp. CCAP 1446/10]